MLKKLLFTLAFALVLNINAQEELVTIKNSSKTSSSTVKDVVPMVNELNQELSLFFMDSKKIYGYLMNADFEVYKKLTTDNHVKKHELLIGNSISENNDYRMYLSNDKYSKFTTVNFSYERDTVTVKELDLKLNKERFVETINYNNTFKLLTVSEKEPVLNIYVFDEEANYKKQQLDFSNDPFINSKGKTVLINDLLEETTKIEENSLNSIDLTAELSKLVVSGDQLIFSFDQNKDSTQILAIDLSTYEKQIRRMAKPYNDPKAKPKRSNSYINNKHLFTIAASKDYFTFAVQNLRTGVLIDQYAITAKDTITFKNSSIIQVGAVYENYRELEKTKKFLQKITYGNVGISALSTGSQYQLFLGGQHEYRANVGGSGMIKYIQGDEIISGELQVAHFNPAHGAYNLYSNTQSTYIKSLLNDSFKHLEGDIKSNAFDKVKDFEAGKVKSKNLKTIFKYQDDFLFGEYFVETNQFKLRKFSN